MKAGRLEVDCGGMFAGKSTALQKHGERHLIAGRKVVFVKPKIDGRYGDDVVSTHNGNTMKAISLWFDDKYNHVDAFLDYKELIDADVVCVDEVQFFSPEMVRFVDNLIYMGKRVYVAGLDLDSNGEPFGIMPILMAKSEKVTKHQAVCSDCGEDAWVSVATKKKEGQVEVGNDYKPACRRCSVAYIGGADK